MRELPRHLILKDFYLWFNIKEKEEKNLELMSKEEVADEILNYFLEMK